MPNFDLSKYVDVAERIEQFYKDHPDGRLVTDLVNVANWNGNQSQFIVYASAFVGDTLRATGLAEESLGGTGANKTAALENAETSAIGRALANMGYQTSRDGERQRPSREEMEKVQRGTPLEELLGLMGESGFTVAILGDIIEAAIGRRPKNPAEMSDEEIRIAITALEGAIADKHHFSEEPL